MPSTADLNADLGYMSAQELVKAYKNQDLSPVEVTKAVYERIKTYDPELNAFSALMEETALEAASASEARYRSGEAGVLDGVPISIKQAYDVAGVETATDCLAIPARHPTQDNPVVARLRQAGAVLTGKTNMSELGWSGISRNPVTGITHNPWGRGLNAGASSAGAGVAAAAGFGSLHLGSDGAGSIRMPAHFCGIYGLKPTYGRVPHYPVSNNDLATYIGPMSPYVSDAALMLEVMAGPYPLDHTCCESAPAPYLQKLTASMKGKRVAFSPDLGFARVDPEIADIVSAAVGKIETELGADVAEIKPEWGPDGAELGRFFWSVLWGRREGLLDEWEDQMGSDLVACIREGAQYSAADYIVTRERKYAYIARIAKWFEDWDYLVTPTCSVAAFPVERVQPENWPGHSWDWLAWSEFLYPFNMNGNPAASIPCGFTKAGLPVGLQIVGKRFDDLGVLQMSEAFQKMMPLWHQRPALG